jgi:hypothetical protein
MRGLVGAFITTCVISWLSRQVRAQQPPTWRAAADNFENLLVLVFQLWCAAQPPCCHRDLALPFTFNSMHTQG